MKKYQTQFKLEIVKRFLAGEGGPKLLSRQWSVPEEKIRMWVHHYRLHGMDRLSPKRSAYSGEFKLKVPSHQDREQLSSRQVAAIYNIRNPNQVVVWRRNLGEGSVQIVRNSKQGHPLMVPERRCLAPPGKVTVDPAPTLLEENQRLRGGRLPKKIAGLDQDQEISCADKARLIAGLRLHHKLADLLQIAGLARSTFYYQCQAIARADQHKAMKASIRGIYDKHKGRYGYRRITVTLSKSMAQPVDHKCMQSLCRRWDSVH